MTMLSRIHFRFMAPSEQKNLDKVLSFDLSFGFENSNTLGSFCVPMFKHLNGLFSLKT